jgi:ferredoxin
LRIIADRDRCVSAGQCVLMAPGVFDQAEEDGQVVVLSERPPIDAQEDVHEAVVLCPSGAIRLVE